MTSLHENDAPRDQPVGPKSVVIGIVEDDEALAGRLCDVINDSPVCRLGFCANSFADALSAIQHSAPDLCLIDLDLPDGTGMDLVRPLHEVRPEAKILVLTVLGDRNSVLTALRGGADGYLLKDAPPAQLISHITATLAGETPISPRAASHVLKALRPDTLTRAGATEAGETLPARDLEVLRLFSRGLTYKEVAEVLGLSPHTVGDRVKAIYSALRVHTRAEAVFEARQLGLIDPFD
ncbi:MAG: response regulator transcription factor [Pseudomonadota bacterium]